MVVRLNISETQKRRSLEQRMTIIHGTFLLLLLVVVARLLELQVVRGTEYREAAQVQHFGGVVLPAKRGEIFSRGSKTGEQNILATNTTLDLVYVDPLISDDPTTVSETLADILFTQEFYDACHEGHPTCPRELVSFFIPAFDPILRWKGTQSGMLQPIGASRPSTLPDIPEARRLFARDIERRISEKRVTFVPLKYGATKIEMRDVTALGLRGIFVNADQKLIYANPEEVDQSPVDATARRLAQALTLDSRLVRPLLRSRPLRYVPIMRHLPPSLSLRIKERQLQSLRETQKKRRQASSPEAAQEIPYPLRSIALLPEHWRLYPDTTIASHVIGFLNQVGEAQYGIERTFNPQLRGQEGLISTVSDPYGGQILTAEQKIINPRDGDSIVLTIDRTVQKAIEEILQRAIEIYQADSGQVIVMDPMTGRIIAMVNAPLFDSNNYASVYEKETLHLDPDAERKIIVEVYHPETNVRILRDYKDNVFTPDGSLLPVQAGTGTSLLGRGFLSEKTRKLLEELNQKYDLRDFTRTYLYLGQTVRVELFPTTEKGIWLKYRNNIGVGAYLNRTIQEIYEPGSVMKPITMAIALDEGEVNPGDTYDDLEDVKVDEYTIKNALLTHYGRVTMAQCLEFSINTCMTSVGFKLGPKLFERMMERFGFGHITGIELEDELPGEVLPWREWRRSTLANTAFGQGFSATPLQMITAWSALANGGKLLRPSIVDSIIFADGTVEKKEPHVVDQVITPETSDTITAMLTSSATIGFAKSGKVPGYKIAGKTGTSQIAGPGGKYETGTGSTVATYAGFAPVSHPTFVVLVKLDRPKFRLTVHGAATAGPVFKEVAAFLFKYYGIPPDER